MTVHFLCNAATWIVLVFHLHALTSVTFVFICCKWTVNVVHDHLINTTARLTYETQTTQLCVHTGCIWKALHETVIIRQHHEKTKGNLNYEKGGWFMLSVGSLVFQSTTRIFQSCFRCNWQKVFTIRLQTDLMSIRLLLPSSTGARLRILNAISVNTPDQYRSSA